MRGVATNLRFLDQIITHPRFAHGQYTTRFIDETPELYSSPERRDRATRILTYLADTVVNGNTEVLGRPRPERPAPVRAPRLPAELVAAGAPPPGCKQRLAELGPERFAQWMCTQQRVLLTDTTMRDAHQSLLATRMRTIDMAAVAPAYAALLPQLFSVECWGGATFDVAMRFLKAVSYTHLDVYKRQLIGNPILRFARNLPGLDHELTALTHR